MLVIDETVRALRAATGATVWESPLPSPLHSNPAYAGGVLYVPTKESIQLLDAATGATRGSFRWDPRAPQLGNLVAAGQTLIGVYDGTIAAMRK